MERALAQTPLWRRISSAVSFGVGCSDTAWLWMETGGRTTNSANSSFRQRLPPFEAENLPVNTGEPGGKVAKEDGRKKK